MKIGINGLGRIGRCVLRAIFELNFHNQIDLVAINGSTNIDIHKHLIQYDSVHGKFPYNVHKNSQGIEICGKTIPLLLEKDPANIPWEKYGVEIVIECTGKFNTKELSQKHLNSTVKKVIVSAPVSDSDCTIIYGVNNSILKSNHDIISAGSCTTNCVAPILDIMDNNVGIKSGFITTIHSYTNDQNLVDNNHKDIRRARACMMSIIPTTTGATKTIELIIPHLKGKINGTAIRVPTPNISMSNIVFNTVKETNKNEINNIIKNESQTSEVISFTEEKLVSIDFTHTTYSAIVDLSETNVIDNNLCYISAWYDNEWAFAVRLLDIATLLKQYLDDK
ncbi:type I glyceraldehyde-3-phosphate dehydrogenase [Neoehrlichia mikurensis]|uniref:Type I glyceraldehyde-3-phosphate dehydrogenase n=1 Tax=Neoehrlichia mikurensis TaxID=89586 RepID=A0A9Q9F4R1_9RICK|nr:type I glyceraldehyde-3-phosphate dehydrogenase [Neoehrlichia mikurensis]QXK92384.1 type I glyceraldehyde-3-phosphate dehydrogenase [Neoehrlichia mikurensis]QXK93231.1 type I glyceraldehyde-3-phosphate dehydrogenase [Neoehrlichia mikurensis]QXK94076.1 type I glyceraldehyde-3-phosphate dehydrogenase [Neoehrlichia mikurensis]UTO55938.1 type I glyceraldehyde-3-phosphate dehydrogenase [Neoehrlichia mikurensis]UTO56856.1 type I glyceraldehyde-3-phosphate dehydrogenase [Neoehrlichia mikurensis]